MPQAARVSFCKILTPSFVKTVFCGFGFSHPPRFHRLLSLGEVSTGIGAFCYAFTVHRHESFIRHCLTLAEHGRRFVGNGAMVGSVLVRKGSIIAEGWHAAFGDLHAEANVILSLLKDDQVFQQEDILYVNMEPCCHTGKTSPCVDRIIAAGIKRVCFGMFDPDSRVAGKGIAALTDAGIQVIGPVLPEVCRRVNKGFVSVRESGRPYITLKQARTADGRTANPDGSPKKITSKEQNIWSHTWLRETHDAIAVGIGTVLSDNPHLTIRLSKKSDQVFQQPYKIIFDAKLQIPTESHVCTEQPDRTIIVTDSAAERSEKAQMLRNGGVMVFGVPSENGVFDWGALWKILVTPQRGFFGITSILVESGASTWNVFHRDAMLDEEVMLIGA